MTAIKICGITNSEDALQAASCGVDALGFIFYPGSPRYVSPAVAKSIMAGLPESVARVGVFVNQDVAEVIEIIDFCRLDFIQLHGDESPAYCRNFSPSMLIKAISAAGADVLQIPEQYAVRAILVDARDGDRFGGTGKVSDWGLAAEMAAVHPVILAGGLNESNIIAAIESVLPAAVDINSGVEISPGKKDHEKIRRIVRMIRMHTATCLNGIGIFRR
jgi:phosphoribosylanthranilate isomerase